MLPPSSTSTTLPPTPSFHLLAAFTRFLTVFIHNTLFYRALYPPPTFLSARAYNLPVHQSRHPAVCAWVRDAVAAVRAQLVEGAAERVALAIVQETSNSSTPNYRGRSGTCSPKARVIERWIFDVAAFPAWKDVLPGQHKKSSSSKSRFRPTTGKGKGKAVLSTSNKTREPPLPDRDADSPINWTDVDEQLRGAVARLAHAAEALAPLPEGCTFTVAVELRDDDDVGVDAPIGYPQPWIPSGGGRGDVGGRDVRTTAVRSVEAGPLFFECWVEEGEEEGEEEDEMGGEEDEEDKMGEEIEDVEDEAGSIHPTQSSDSYGWGGVSSLPDI